MNTFYTTSMSNAEIGETLSHLRRLGVGWGFCARRLWRIRLARFFTFARGPY